MPDTIAPAPLSVLDSLYPLMTSFLTDEHYSLLTRLLSYFSSSYGPHGRLKLIRTLESSMSICTSRSSRLQSQLKCRHLLSRLLTAAIGKQLALYHDGGLYLTIVFCNFLLQTREITTNGPQRLALFRSSLDLVDQMSIPTEAVTFESVQPLLALVRGVMCKPLAYKNSEHCREQLCLLTVKSFLENVTMKNSSQQQLILTLEGLPATESTLFNGLLYQMSSMKSLPTSTSLRRCLLFNISLAGDYAIDDVDTIETHAHTFEWIQTAAERIVEQILQYTSLHHGGWILCQKVCSST